MRFLYSGFLFVWPHSGRSFRIAKSGWGYNFFKCMVYKSKSSAWVHYPVNIISWGSLSLLKLYSWMSGGLGNSSSLQVRCHLLPISNVNVTAIKAFCLRRLQTHLPIFRQETLTLNWASLILANFWWTCHIFITKFNIKSGRNLGV